MKQRIRAWFLSRMTENELEVLTAVVAGTVIIAVTMWLLPRI